MRRNIPPLTSLRFLAALWVFVFHLYLWHGGKAPGVLDRLVLAGPVGMSFFFVLSGFILAQSAAGTDPLGSYQAYAARRFARIYPIYLVVLLCSWTFVGFAGELGESPVRSGIAHGVADLSLTNAWFPQMFMGGFIRGGSWSLSVEAFFYALFPLIYYHTKDMTDRSLVIGIRWAVGLLVFFSLIGKYVQPFDPTARFAIFYSMPIFRLPEFVAGVFAGTLATRDSGPAPTGRAAAWAGGGTILFLAVFAKALPEVALGVVVVPCLLVVFAYFTRRKEGPVVCFFSHPLFVFLGEASFALYLVQLVTIPLFAVHAKAMDRNQAVAVCFVVTLGLACLAHLVVERPLRPLVARWLSPRPPRMSAPLVQFVDIPQRGDARGGLAVAELGGALPFPVRRIYWIHGTQPGASRGFHAHKRLRQLCVCVAGSVRMSLFDGRREETVVLDLSAKGLLIGPGLWREMHDFSTDCVLMVFADAEYDEADYIRDREQFIRHVHSS